MPSVEYPWPSSALSPNARHGHWSQRSVPAKAAREQAYWLTVNAKLPPFPDEGEIWLRVTFYPPSKRRYDLDGLLSRAKNLLDGFADAMQINDYRFALILRRAEPVKGGRVIIEIV